MKILVGTLHSIENELKQCLAAIGSQTLPAYDAFLISGKPNKEAHDELYSKFMARAAEVDLFVKIDADMILTRPTFFEEIAGHFAQRPGLGHLMIAVDDWITDRRIMGLHVFRNTHRWSVEDELYFVDTNDESTELEKDYERFSPAAVHCGNPSPFQAFHYGLHKAVKYAQFTRLTIDHGQRETHWRHFKGLTRHYRRNRDRRLALARAGFLHALAHRFDFRHVDYSCAESQAAFNEYAELDARQIDARVRHFGPVAWNILPFRLRRIAANQMLP